MDNQPALTMREGAIGVHEIYSSYMEAGFSSEQAFELTKLIMQQGMQA